MYVKGCSSTALPATEAVTRSSASRAVPEAGPGLSVTYRVVFQQQRDGPPGATPTAGEGLHMYGVSAAAMPVRSWRKFRSGQPAPGRHYLMIASA